MSIGRRIWEISTDPEDAWHDSVARPKGGQSLLERFVTFRNHFVHGQIRLVEDHAVKLAQAGGMFEEMRALAGRLDEGGADDEHYFKYNTFKSGEEVVVQ